MRLTPADNLLGGTHDAAEPLTSSQGAKVLVEESWERFDGADLVFVPGGRYTRLIVENQDFLEGLSIFFAGEVAARQVCERAELRVIRDSEDGPFYRLAPQS